MYLLVDIGNTRTKYVIAKNDEFEQVTLSQLSNVVTKLDKIVVSAVREDEEFDKLVQHLDSKMITNVEVQPEAFGIKCGYENYQNLGIDRWLAVLGAELLHPGKKLLIADFGTATTIDVLEGNKHLGGYISPGLELMQSSIVDKAPGVFSAKDKISIETWGSDTPSALHHGCVMSQVGLLEKSVHNFPHCDLVVVTGGSANYVTKHTSLKVEFEPNLIFHGMLRFVQ